MWNSVLIWKKCFSSFGKIRVEKKRVITHSRSKSAKVSHFFTPPAWKKKGAKNEFMPTTIETPAFHEGTLNISSCSYFISRGNIQRTWLTNPLLAWPNTKWMDPKYIDFSPAEFYELQIPPSPFYRDKKGEKVSCGAWGSLSIPRSNFSSGFGRFQPPLRKGERGALSLCQ